MRRFCLGFSFFEDWRFFSVLRELLFCDYDIFVLIFGSQFLHVFRRPFIILGMFPFEFSTCKVKYYAIIVLCAYPV